MKPVLTIQEATLLATMHRLSEDRNRITDCELWERAKIAPPLVRRSMFRLQELGLVRLQPPPGAGWQLTRKGERRQLLLQLLPGEVAAMNTRGRSGGGDNFLAEADVLPGPSRAMYPASVLQGRGG
jgi:predicted transcriptional regulator